MLYGRPLKHIRHHTEQNITLEPQRFFMHQFWAYHGTATTRTDGLDLKDNAIMPLGSKVTKHKMDILVTPETIEPQQIYMGRVKLSFQDILNESHCGGHWVQANYGDEAAEIFTAKTTPIATHLFPDDAETGAYRVKGSDAANQEIGGSGSGFGIQELLLDDNIKHVLNLKKITVFDQRPLMGERFQRIPSKVKRINSGTYYGLFIFNDSVRGGTPADTQVKINIKDYIEELAI